MVRGAAAVLTGCGVLAGLVVWTVMRGSSNPRSTLRHVQDPLKATTAADQLPADIPSIARDLEEAEEPLEHSMVQADRKPIRGQEPTCNQLRQFEGFAPPREIRGIILRGLEPIPDARVTIRGGRFDQRWGEIRDELPETWSCTSDEDGRYAIGNVAEGRYVVRVDLESGETQEAYLNVREDSRQQVCVHAFGWSLVEGTVHDEGGSPVAGAHLVLSGRLNSPNSLGCVREGARFTPDEHGNYRMPGLLSGTWTIEPFTDGSTLDAKAFQFDLAPHERLELDLGCPRGTGRWKGAVVAGNGRRRTLAVFRIRLTDSRSGVEWNFDTSEDGTFNVAVAKGDHQIAVSLRSQEWPLNEPLVMPADDLQRDLVIPGATLEVRLMEDGEVFSRIGPRLRVRSGVLQPRLGPDADGRFTWIGLKAGDYSLELPGLRDFAIGDPQEFPLVIPEDQRAMAIDVPVKVD